MKRVLIVSDNPQLTHYFQTVCAELGISKIADVTYLYSKVNKTPSKMIALGCSPVDLSDPRVVGFIKESNDLIISLHCKQLFPDDLVTSVVCINIHPGYNPHNRGWYPQAFSIVNKKQAGATIHVMDEEIDHGAIIDQVKVNICSFDTSLDVYEKVIAVEKKLIKKNLVKMINGEYSSKAPEMEGNYNTINDFNSLCRIDLDDVGTFRDHIDLLRALSHGEFKNAFFYDAAGVKVFVNISLDVEKSVSKE